MVKFVRALHLMPALLAFGFGLTLVRGLCAAEKPVPPTPPPTEEQLRQALIDEIERVRAARERQAQFLDAHRKLAAGDFAGAAALLKPLVAEKPEAPLLVDLGQAEIGRQEFAAARHAFLQALDLDPTGVPARRGLGWLDFQAADYTGALQRWEPLLREGQRDAELLERAGQCYYFTGRRRAALDCFNAAALGRPADHELDRWRIFCAQDIGEYGQADRLSRAYLAQDPDDIAVRRIAAHSAAAVDRREDAVLQLERLNLDGHMTAPDWLLLSDLYGLLGDDTRAADCLEAAWPAGPEGHGRDGLAAADWLRLGNLEERAGRSDLAAAAYRQVPTGIAESGPAALGLARLAAARRDAELTVTHCKAALAARPDLGEAQLLLGTACEQLGRSQEAETAYEKAATQPALAAAAELGLARIAYLDRRLSAALRHYQAAADLRPADPTLPRIIRQLEDHLAAVPAANPAP